MDRDAQGGDHAGVKYFHVVFTVPDCLHPIAITRQALFYGCMSVPMGHAEEILRRKGTAGRHETSILHRWLQPVLSSAHPLHRYGRRDKDGVVQFGRGARDSKGSFPCPALKGVPCQVPAIPHPPLKNESGCIPQELRKKCMEKGWLCTAIRLPYGSERA